MSSSTTALPQVFVSHSHFDNVYCRDFVAALRQELGSEEAVWYDEHNLGWGALRRVIEQELAQRQHFIAILSPTAVDSEWVNDEIDAARELRRRGSMHTIQFVLALPCQVPLLLSGYKRIVGPDDHPYGPQESAVRALAVIRPASAPTPSSATGVTPAPVQQVTPPPAAPSRQTLPASSPAGPVLAPDHLPQQLASLGFTGFSSMVNGKQLEWLLPPLAEVPADPFKMGDDQHSVTLPFYQIARYPVTVAEYACFVRAGHGEPSDWQKQRSQVDHPVVYVSWNDATAYSAWLSERTGQSWRLPSEEEWEKAARGPDGRVYPWGDSFDKARCNTTESGIKGTTPIGKYPSGASPYGAQDMAGNVWEWTASRYNNSTENRVLRGGSWNFNARVARAAYRLNLRPGYVNYAFGFRLVVGVSAGS